MKQVTRFSISLLLTVVCLALFWFVLDFDVGEVGRSLRAASPALIGLGIALNLLGIIIRAWRWRFLLAPIRPGLGMYGLTSATFIGYMVSFLIPFRVGEIVRPVLLARREGINAGSAIATIAVERILDVLTISGLFLVFLLTPRGPTFLEGFGGDAGGAVDYIRSAIIAVAGLVIVVFPVLGLLVFAPHRVISRLRRLSERFGSGFIGRTAVLLEGFVGGLTVIRRARELLRACLLSLLMWLVIDLGILAGVRAVGIDLAFTDILLLMVPLAIGIAIPTPAGVGAYESLVSISLRDFWGVAASAAAATAVLLHAMTVVPIILLGMLFMWRDGLGWSEVRGLGHAGGTTPRAAREGEGKAG